MRLYGVEITPVGRLDDACPSCDAALSRRPSRKVTCPACGEPIYVRSRPFDRQRALVHGFQAAELDLQWDAVSRLKRALHQLAWVAPTWRPLLDRIDAGTSALEPMDWLQLGAAAFLQIEQDPFPAYLDILEAGAANAGPTSQFELLAMSDRARPKVSQFIDSAHEMANCEFVGDL